jgi:DNA-directed RNA polymerase specialized sigma24 family protein
VIPYIDARLQAWARWVFKRDGGMGYAHRTMEQRLRDEGGVLISSTSRYDPGLYEDEMEIDRAIAGLTDDMKNAVIACYIVQGVLEQRTAYCRCSKSTYYERLDRAHIRIMDHLNMASINA